MTTRASTRHRMIILFIACAITLLIWTMGTQRQVIVETITPAPSLGIVVDSNLVIVHVEPNSAAQLAGVQRGDRVVAFDALSVSDQKGQVRQAIQAAKSGSQHGIRILRGGRGIEMIIMPKIPSYNSLATPTPVLPPFDYY